MFALKHTWDSPIDWIIQASFLGERSLDGKKRIFPFIDKQKN